MTDSWWTDAFTATNDCYAKEWHRIWLFILWRKFAVKVTVIVTSIQHSTVHYRSFIHSARIFSYLLYHLQWQLNSMDVSTLTCSSFSFSSRKASLMHNRPGRDYPRNQKNKPDDLRILKCRNLRQKRIKICPSAQHLEQTVHGSGYGDTQDR